MLYKNNRNVLFQLQKYAADKTSTLEKLNKIDECFHQIVLFVARKNQLL